MEIEEETLQREKKYLLEVAKEDYQVQDDYQLDDDKESQLAEEETAHLMTRNNTMYKSV